ncbi:MAG TPA: ABC transporter ATP-binding protein [Candidatus Acidoferrales bacterium]|nr:ABC transporter ATP-binding protein [Candidatus Acidoferrales bacterium]
MHQSAAPPSVQGADRTNSLNAALPALAVRHLTKRFGALTAVDDLSFEVAAGDFFGLLGPNGAGKTTTINAIVGLARGDAGTIDIFGHDNVAAYRQARSLVGLAPQEYNFDRYLSIREILIYQAGYFGLRGPQINARADELLAWFGLESKAKDVFTRLSGGMKRRLTLARALIHSPRLLILDEPTAGVDVELRLELWDLLRRLNGEGMTIILTTHYLEEAELLCRNLAIIEGGRIVAHEPTKSLLARQGRSSLTLTVDRPLSPLPPALAAHGAYLDGSPRTLRIEGVAPAEIGRLLADLERAGYAVEDLEVSRASLQDVFLDLTRR